MSKIKIAYIAAGAGGMYCGNCLHDNTLAAALTQQGHEVLLVPIYTPLKTDEQNVSLQRVFFGGINVYLDQYSAWYRRLPGWMVRWLDSPALLRLVTRYSSLSMKAEELGSLTVSMLRGEEGHQSREIEALVEWLAEIQPDVVHLSNVMLVGLARRIRQRLNVPILSTLSGEDLFLSQLQEPYTSQAYECLWERTAELDGFVALNHYYADRMSELLRVDRSRFHVVPHGLALQGHGTRCRPDGEETFTIGYLGRISPEKGIKELAEAFIELHKQPDLPPLRLRLAGYLAPGDKPYLAGIEKTLKLAQLSECYNYAGSVDFAGKVAFLQSLDCLAMPTVYPESKGLPVIEALANAVPVVVPAHGAFPEAIEMTGGGLLCEPNDLLSLTETLASLARDPDRAAELGRQGQAAVREHFGAELMARRTYDLYTRILATAPAVDSAAAPSLAEAAR